MRYARSSVVAVFCMAAWSGQARAEGFVFDLGNTSIIAGSGEQIIQQNYPPLAGRGFGAQLEQQLAPTVSSLSTQLRDDITARLAPLNFSSFLRNTANASALSAKAAPVDHATAFRIFSLSVGGGAGLSGLNDMDTLRHPDRLDERIEAGQAPEFGVAPEASILLGIHLGKFNMPKWRYFDLNKMEVFVSGFGLSLAPKTASYAIKAEAYGAHFKYQVLGGRTLAPYGLVRWHGLNVITGLGYSKQRFTFRTNLAQSEHSEDVMFQGQQLRTTASWTGEANLGAKMYSFTIPIEVASAIELLHAVTFYGGLAVDFNIGRADLSANARAPVQVTAAGNRGSATLVSQPTPTLSYALSRRPAPVDARGFFGLQLGGGAFAVFAQATADSSKSVAGHAGVRGFW